MNEPSVSAETIPHPSNLSSSTRQGKLSGAVGWAAGALLAVLVYAAGVSTNFGNADANILNVYDLDEYYGLSILKESLHRQAPFYQGGVYEHGSFYPALTYSGLRLLEGLGFVITDKLIIVVSRMLSLLAYALLIGFTCRLARSLGITRPFDLIAAAVMASTPDFFYYAQIIHPDTLQAALIVAAFVVAFSRHDFRHAMGACAILGLATATKLAGLHAIPFVILPASLAIATANPAQRKWCRLLAGWTGCALVATTSFFAVDPEVFMQFDSFTARMQMIQRNLSVGWGKVDPKNPLLWFDIIRHQYGLLLSLVLAAGLLAAVLWVVRLRRSRVGGWPILITDEQCVRVSTLLLYVGLVFTLIAVQVNMRAARFLQHLLPVGVVVAIFGVDRLVQKVAPGARSLSPLAGAALLVLAGQNAKASIGQFAETVSQREVSETVQASEWILANYGPDVAIAADPYTYRAPAFRNWAQDVCIGREIERLEADQGVRLLVISSCGSGRFVWKQGSSFALDHLTVDSDYRETPRYLDFIQRVLRGIAPWKIVFENRDILVLERKPAAAP